MTARFRCRALGVGALVAVMLAGGASSAQAAGSSFTAVGSMSTVRLQPAAATLSNGETFVVGGSANGTYLSSIERFDPATNAFSAAGAMTVPRQSPVAAPLPGGRMLIAGGLGSSGNLSSAEIYDPRTGTSTPTGSMVTARHAAAAAPLPGGDVLIAGGQNAGGLLDSAEIYDPNTGTFSAVAASMTTKRFFATATALPDGDVLIAGGFNMTAGFLSSAELFDPTTDTFTALSARMTIPTMQAAAASLPDGRVLIAGGRYDNYLSNPEIYDPTTETFSTDGASLLTARVYAAAAPLSDGRVLVAGGDNGSGTDLATAETFSGAPEARADPLSFGPQMVGTTSATKVLTVKDLGPQPLRIDGATLTGPNAGDFAIASDGCAGVTIDFNQTCAVSLRMTPSAAGPRNAMLTLQDDEVTPSALSVSGTGVTASNPSGTPNPPAGGSPAGPDSTGTPAAGGARRPGISELVVWWCAMTSVAKNQRHCVLARLVGSVPSAMVVARVALAQFGRVRAVGKLITKGSRRVITFVSSSRLLKGTYALTLRYRRGRRVQLIRVRVRLAAPLRL